MGYVPFPSIKIYQVVCDSYIKKMVSISYTKTCEFLLLPRSIGTGKIETSTFNSNEYINQHTEQLE